MNIATFGNDLYTGRRSIDFVGRRKTWYLISLVLFVLAVAGLGVRQLNLGIEFTGGSDFRVASVSADAMNNFESKARETVAKTGGVEGAKVTQVGNSDVRVETGRLDADKATTVANSLAQTFGVPHDRVTTSVIGPSWGASVSKQALQALAWFLVLVSAVLAIYFRTWKMALSALVALFHDIFITVGIYALAGFEVTPASMIGFLTILGYSLYDTVVVFDKVRENTTEAIGSGRRTYSEAANLAVNQTLVRSINTTVVALLPVAAILVIGIVAIGPGTLVDLSLALFVGIAVGAYSSIFIATPLLAHLREREPSMQDLAHRVERRRQRAKVHANATGFDVADEAAAPGDDASGSDAQSSEPGRRTTIADRKRAARAAGRVIPHDDDDDDDAPRTVTGRRIHPSLQSGGPRNQPRRVPRSKR
ncbi:Protein translocase subunit SecF [Austwickia sp. TVS 96-490-7B]|uniref:protein translocase subunit SecF n=1 Tax=Austwickia sp. TVS 96-490-7B TaxID=2830843 RepID=UPI001C583458|nr:protein translocase subunit SecF [Austwickia sp. TVS 96-490-7B]MBW3086302.1 Protein translocase subunit SecF [Austwickia sp. TVS 96-490-7B]